MESVLEDAIERQHNQFLEEANAAFALLRADTKAWKKEQAERALWDNTIADGLDK